MKVPQSQPNDEPSIITVALIGMSFGSGEIMIEHIARPISITNAALEAIYNSFLIFPFGSYSDLVVL